MKLSFKFIYLLPLFMVLSTDTLFIQMGIDTYKPVAVLFTAVPFFFVKEFSPFMRAWFILLTAYFAFLCLESYYYYNTPLKYLHVSAKIMIVFSLFGVYGFYKRFGHKTTLKGLLFIILTAFTANAVLVNSSAFSIGAFIANNRGIASESVYLLIIPLIYNLNSFMKTNNLVNMLSFFVFFGIIMFLQHRTVWISMAVALLVNFLLLFRTDIRPQFTAFVLAIFFVFLFALAVTSFVLSDDKVQERLQVSIDQLANPTKNDKADQVSTSEWRYLQIQSYWPFIEEYPVFGMRHWGFELPLQFYDHTGNLPFEDGTGHHFHSFYIDKLFYFGLLGLLLMTLPFLIYVGMLAIQLQVMSTEQLVLLAYISTGLMFGLSYNWPEYFYGMIGYTIYQLEKNIQPNKENLNARNKKIEKSELLVTTEISKIN